MQIPTASMASTVLLSLGRFHLAAVAQSTETAGLGSAFQPTYDALEAAESGRQQAERALALPRVATRFAEYEIESILRGVAAFAHAVDSNLSTGPAFKAVFPSGLDAEVRPRGAAQLNAAKAVRERVDKQPAAAKVRTDRLAELDAGIAKLAAALEARTHAGQVLGITRAAEDGARESFCAAYDSNAGAVRQLFPKQRARQDLYFDEFRSRPGSDLEDEAQAEGAAA